MNKDNDVLKQLEEKNREIYLNKLYIDLDNNNEILHIITDNVINLFKEEVINKILEINPNSEKNEIKKCVNDFYKKIKQEIVQMLNNRYNNLKREISNIDEIDYQICINNERKIIIDEIKKMYGNLVIELINEIEHLLNNSNDRINNYLQVLNYDKFVNKIKELINNMNVILYNSYIESNNKFQDLNAKTLNK